MPARVFAYAHSRHPADRGQKTFFDFSPTQDFTNNGLSHRFDTLMIPNEEQASAFDDSDLYNANGVLVGPYIKLVGDHFEPIANPKKGFMGWMYGGNDVVVDGVRYRLHDRQESRSEYLSYN